MMRNTFTIFLLISCFTPVFSQTDMSELFKDSLQSEKSNPVISTFKSPRIINARTNETLHKYDLQFMVIHRFGDIAGDFGGLSSFYGLDNSTDILIGFEYGISDQLSVGIGRTKGAPNGTSTFQSELFFLDGKLRILQQTKDNHIPVSLTLFGNSVVSATEESDLVTSDTSFDKFGDRMSYTSQLILSRKFSDQLSLVLLPTYIHRNLVTYQDMNNLFALGIGGRLKVSRRMAVVFDYFHSFRSQESEDYFLRSKKFEFYNPLSVGLEIETGGHVFSLDFTNSTAILENQFIPSTSSNWGDGEFRWGFSISRTFTLKENYEDYDW
ncbi:DUF5777 family beta-barrel protein [Sunxiuqinia indica]|uniref:DUF5777 family beta-barrel protein n=1 Tax=Sunxiuqinia indica TaxID=2692584 RepID=UPI00135B9218|nr:DUF5777 family beta-barrel protein [Sunxiuqinia indica]